MTKQNRVTPFGELIADPARGAWMGNRGCLHDDRQQIVHHHVGKRWIICKLAFKDYHRAIMTPRRYTELFFLDEATALAAGHRPCAECQRARFEEFRCSWTRGNPELAGGPRPGAAVIDTALHAERVDRRQEKTIFIEMLCNLPEGVIVAGKSALDAYLVWEGELLRWTPAGYTLRAPVDSHWEVKVLTPRTVVRAIRAGYIPQVHPSACGPD